MLGFSSEFIWYVMGTSDIFELSGKITETSVYNMDFKGDSPEVERAVRLRISL